MKESLATRDSFCGGPRAVHRFVVLVFFLIMPHSAHSETLIRTGLSLLEEGDDRWRRGVNLSGRYKHYQIKGTLFRRSFGPVSEQTILLSAVRFYKLPYLGASFLSVGLVGLEEQTEIRYRETEQRDYNILDRRRNLGVSGGVHWTFTLRKRLFYSLDWESSIFPAGLLPGLLLATGRKQVLSLTLGYKF